MQSALHGAKFLFFCCILLHSCPATFAKAQSELVQKNYFRFQSGDNSVWADPDFDDSAWQEFEIGSFPHGDWQGIGWFRFAVNLDSLTQNDPFKPIGLLVHQAGAVEVYIGGILIYRMGQIAANPKTERAFHTRYPHPVAVSLPAAERHIVAVRYSSQFLGSVVWSGMQPHFDFIFGDLDAQLSERENLTRKATFHQMFIVGGCLAATLLHLLLYFFYPEPRANLYYGMLTASAAAVVFFNFQNYFLTGPAAILWNIRNLYLAATALIILSQRFTYSLIYPKSPKLFIAFCTVGSILVVGSWFRPFVFDRPLAVFWLIGIAEMARAIVFSFRKPHQPIIEGGWILALGATPLLLSGAYQFLVGLEVTGALWDFVDFPAPYYAMLSLMISMSIVLARNFGSINRNLKDQIVQVKKLSEQTLQQEIERTKLEAENERKSRELEQARQLQQSMLPKSTPSLPNLDIAFYMLPATEVGGDYYDFITEDGGMLTLAIGDATGHGLHAGTMVTATKSLFNAFAHETEPVIILQNISAGLKPMGFKNMFMALTIVKLESRRLRMANAGMPITLVFQAATGNVEEIILKGLPLGSFANYPYEHHEILLQSGDSVLFMSDGFSEMFNPNDKMLGEKQTMAFFREVGHKQPGEIINHLVAAGRQWANGRAQHDDVTFVVVKIK